MTDDQLKLSDQARDDLAYLQRTLGASYKGFTQRPGGEWEVKLVQVYRTTGDLQVLDERLETHYGATLDDALARARRSTEDAVERVQGA